MFFQKCSSFGHLIVDCKKLDRMVEEKIERDVKGGAPPKDLRAVEARSLEGGMVVTLSPRKKLEEKNPQTDREKGLTSPPRKEQNDNPQDVLGRIRT